MRRTLKRMATVLIFAMTLWGCTSGGMEPGIADPGSDRWFVQKAHAHLSEMGVKSPAKSFRLERLERDGLGKVHLWMVQRVAGIPVWGRRLQMHMNGNGEVYRIDGEMVPDPGDIQLPPLLDAEEAFRRGISSGGKAVRFRNRGLFLYVGDPRAGVVPVYEMEAVEGLRRRIFLLDARSGAVVKQIEGSPHR